MATFSVTLPDALITAYQEARAIHNARDPDFLYPAPTVNNVELLLKRMMKSLVMAEVMQAQGAGFTLTPQQIDSL